MKSARTDCAYGVLLFRPECCQRVSHVFWFNSTRANCPTNEIGPVTHVTVWYVEMFAYCFYQIGWTKNVFWNRVSKAYVIELRTGFRNSAHRMRHQMKIVALAIQSDERREMWCADRSAASIDRQQMNASARRAECQTECFGPFSPLHTSLVVW